MAEMFFRTANDTCKLGCYSERGMMSYFMFVKLPENVGDFLSSLQFPKDCTNPFADLSGKQPLTTIFSELELGNLGFGNPDGAILVNCPDPIMVLIEVKFNETYSESCRNLVSRSYNSTIKGQLELRWRLCHLVAIKAFESHEGTEYIRETPELKKYYEKNDKFYQIPNRKDETEWGDFRRVKNTEGVQKFLDDLIRCEGRVYFLAITKDDINPFDSDPFVQSPKCGEQKWPNAKKQFCWCSVNKLIETAGK